MRFETPKGIGVAIALWAKTHVRKLKKVSMDGNARAEPCTRESAWFRSATCMVGLAQVHGSARRSAWLRFRRCMVGLSKRGLRTKMTLPKTITHHLGKKYFAFSSLDKSNIPDILAKL